MSQPYFPSPSLWNGIKLGWDNAWVGSQALCPHPLSRKSAPTRAVHSCHLLGWCECAAHRTDTWQTDRSWPLGCAQNVRKGQDILLARLSDLLQLLSKGFLSLSHTQHTHMHAHTTHTNPPALINHYVVQPKVKCLSQGDIGNISCILLWLIPLQFSEYKQQVYFLPLWLLTQIITAPAHLTCKTVYGIFLHYKFSGSWISIFIKQLFLAI